MIKDLSLMAEVTRVEPLTQHILRVFLEPEHYINYHAGQYLQILTAEEALSYSIANAPLGAHHYELHLRHSPQNPLHQHLLSEMRAVGEVPIFLPLGHCHVECFSVDRPLIMLAQGTGFAPMKAMLEYWLTEGRLPPTLFCWLARTPSDWYMQSLVETWDAQVENFKYLPLRADISDEDVFNEVLKQAGFELSDVQVVLAGPFERMCALKQVGIELGLRADQFFSDAF
jgi:CDP-4-dehydro-6-deoxyglucose reductase, E3